MTLPICSLAGLPAAGSAVFALVFLLCDPVAAPTGRAARLAYGALGGGLAALLAGAILVARSPSSAIAVVKELRAHGPFTKTVLGVTVIMDVVVIIAFAGAAAVAGYRSFGTMPSRRAQATARRSRPIRRWPITGVSIRRR